MYLTIYRFTIPLKIWSPRREGLLIQIKNGDQIGWGEVSPLPGRSGESLDEALLQLLSLEKGFSGRLFNSVAFGLKSASLSLPDSFSWPASLLFMGTVEQILDQVEKSPRGFSSAKLKIGHLSVPDAIFVTKKLKDVFHLRLDINQRWSWEEALKFCSHFDPGDFDYIEDPVGDISPFRVAYDEQDSSPTQIEVWKPSVKGVPSFSENIVLGSSFESGLGHGLIALLAHHLSFTKTPTGLGSYHFLEEDLLETPLSFSHGCAHIPSLSPKLHLLEKIKELRIYANRTLDSPLQTLNHL